MFLQVNWQPYSLPERTDLLPEHYRSQLWMIYARVPCICFEVITINCTDLCYKQLGLERKDPCDLPRIRKMKLKQQSKHKGKNWKDCNKSYKDLNDKLRNRNLYLVKKDLQVEEQLINDENEV